VKKGLIIIGHGSRSGDAVRDFQKVVDLVRDKGLFDTVSGAFMELSKPSIPETVKELVSKQVNEIIVVPYFLYEGIHTKLDIPNLINEISRSYPDVIFKMAKPIGVEPILAEILIDRAKAVQ